MTFIPFLEQFSHYVANFLFFLCLTKAHHILGRRSNSGQMNRLLSFIFQPRHYCSPQLFSELLKLFWSSSCRLSHLSGPPISFVFSFEFTILLLPSTIKLAYNHFSEEVCYILSCVICN